MHLLVYHIAEFIETHQEMGLGVFSCSALEKKNHMQVKQFFSKTSKDGFQNRGKTAVMEILDMENRSLYYRIFSIPSVSPKPHIINI
jgi:hypothetical protein